MGIQVTGANSTTVAECRSDGRLYWSSGRIWTRVTKQAACVRNGHQSLSEIAQQKTAEFHNSRQMNQRNRSGSKRRSRSGECFPSCDVEEGCNRGERKYTFLEG